MNYFYGGAFNPMTKAHLYIVGQLIKCLKDNDMLYIAITEHDYKTYEYSYEFRRSIVQKNLMEFFDKKILNNQVRIIKQNCRTWKFLNQYFNKDKNITLVLGEDEYNDLKSMNIWHNSKQILENFKIKVFSRSEETKDISSTKVRELLKQGTDRVSLQKYITDFTIDFFCYN